MRLVSSFNHLIIMSANKRLSGLFLIAYILTGTLLMSSCVKDPTLPVLTTNEVIEITTNSATKAENNKSFFAQGVGKGIKPDCKNAIIRRWVKSGKIR